VLARLAPVAFALAVAACGKTRAVDAEAAAATFDRITLETGGVHGLSGLAVDGAGALWTVAERGRAAFRVELDGGRVASIARVPVEGVPDGEDLEAIGVAGGDRFWVGTEGRQAGVARVYALRHDGAALRVIETAELTAADTELAIGANHGAEGLCVAGDQVVVAIETAAKGPDRWAPVVTLTPGQPRVLHRLHLTTATGKLSGLDCWRDGEVVRAIAIERHFEVTRVLAFDLPPTGGDIIPSVLIDLAPVLRGALNLEGIARLPDGRVVAVVDNQYDRITGPDELLVLRPDRLAGPARSAAGR